MIKSGRNPSPKQRHTTHRNIRGARFTAFFGAVIFTVFLCSSVTDKTETQMTDYGFGEGAYSVFASADTPVTADTDTSAVQDSSIWTYLESAIARLIYGDR